MRKSKLSPATIVFGLITLYSVFQFLWYLQTPLGISPVLDGQENLLLAEKIAAGTLGAEPFYRAMLYPAILAIFPLGHSVLGLICHLINVGLSQGIARRLWKNEQAGLLAAALVGFNPVLLHFAFDPLDTTLAITFFLASVATFQRLLATPKYDSRGLRFAAMAGLFISLATLTRPHFLLTLVALVGIAGFSLLKKRLKIGRLTVFLSALAIPLLAIGFVQQSISGSFRILPAQGSYNLWVSNSPSANGLYYQQSVSFHSLEAHQNPAMAESRFLYQQEHGKTGSVKERNAYWRSHTMESILESPLAWIRLEAFKLYASLNNFEQYNNKTYSFHKKLSPVLRYNPIGWGILLAVACFCATALWRQMKEPLAPFIVISFSILAGLLIFMASSRFRLPLVPLLAVVAAGVPAVWPALKHSSWKLRRKAIVAAVIALVVSFSQFAGVASTRTYIQDALLLADASAKIGDDQKAVEWANYALDIAPNQQNALRISIISQYNQVVSGNVAANASFWKTLHTQSQQLTLQDELLSFIRGVIDWNTGSPESAIEQWESGYASYGLAASSCLAALEIVGSPVEEVRFPVPPEQFLSSGQHPIYAYAIALQLPESERQGFLDRIGFARASYEKLGQSLNRILPHR